MITRRQTGVNFRENSFDETVTHYLKPAVIVVVSYQPVYISPVFAQLSPLFPLLRSDTHRL